MPDIKNIKDHTPNTELIEQLEIFLEKAKRGESKARRNKSGSVSAGVG